MNIIEYIGKEGVKTSHLEINIRAKRPMPGDPVELEDGTIGRIEGFNLFGDDSWHICEKTCGVFMGQNDVSISGGPFRRVKTLEPTFKFLSVDFWNWGDRLRGAGQGVDYYITRPLFKIGSDNE